MPELGQHIPWLLSFTSEELAGRIQYRAVIRIKVKGVTIDAIIEGPKEDVAKYAQTIYDAVNTQHTNEPLDK